MGSGPANIALLLNNHLHDTIKDKRATLARQVAEVRATVAQLVELEAHALLAGLLPSEDPAHGKSAPTPVVAPGPPQAGEAGGGPA